MFRFLAELVVQSYIGHRQILHKLLHKREAEHQSITKSKHLQWLEQFNGPRLIFNPIDSNHLCSRALSAVSVVVASSNPVEIVRWNLSYSQRFFGTKLVAEVTLWISFHFYPHTDHIIRMVPTWEEAISRLQVFQILCRCITTLGFPIEK